VIDDLLDLSRAEIDELNLNTELIEPGALLQETFQDFAGNQRRSGLTWKLELPERLPLIQVDPVRVRQVVLNLLSNANKFTRSGEIILGAEVTPPSLHIWVRDNGAGIPLEQQERIFEPFVTMAQSSQRPDGIGLGLSITRRLVALHQGSMRLESLPGQGSTFHVYLPLPSLSDQPSTAPVSVQSVLLLLSNQSQPTAEISELSRQQGWKIRRVMADENMEILLQEVQPAALAWDLTDSRPGTDHWELVQRLRKYPRLTQLPFILYGYEPTVDPALSSGMISVVFGKTLTEAIGNLRPTTTSSGPILIVEDDDLLRAQHRLVVEKELPGYPIREAENGARALEIMLTETPTLVTLDLMMPGVDGFEVLDWMRANQRLRQVPVLILTNRTLTAEDVRRLEQHARVNIQSKGILLNDEVGALMQQILADIETLPAYTSALVKRTVAYFQQNYHRPLSRKEVAQAIGMSENYLSQIFRQELGISPWEYLNRYRIKLARELLSQTADSITSITLQVGFDDPSYFGRVFHKITGLSPRAYRENKVGG
jgi:AraC-like DNA-binding protein/anti-sigma regulatory factor (Ser/Thr protein kinase)